MIVMVIILSVLLSHAPIPIHTRRSITDDGCLMLVSSHAPILIHTRRSITDPRRRQTGGRIESILMSLPETARWEYDHQVRARMMTSLLMAGRLGRLCMWVGG